MKWKYLGGKDITFYAESLILPQKIPPCPRDAGKNEACKADVSAYRPYII